MTMSRTIIIFALVIAALGYISLRAANTLKAQVECDASGYAEVRVDLTLDGYCVDDAGAVPVSDVQPTARGEAG